MTLNIWNSEKRGQVNELIAGMQFKTEMCPHLQMVAAAKSGKEREEEEQSAELCDRVQTFVAMDVHPVYRGMNLVIWKLCNGEWSFDALSPAMVLPQPGQTLVVNPLTGKIDLSACARAVARALGLPDGAAERTLGFDLARVAAPRPKPPLTEERTMPRNLGPLPENPRWRSSAEAEWDEVQGLD